MIEESGQNTVVITGASGFIGASLIRQLGQSYRIVGFDRASPPHPPAQAECVCIDLTSDRTVKEAMERVRVGYGNKIASVVHLAAYYDFSGEPSPLYEEITVKGTERLLRELEKFEVEQFVFSSSMLVHAPTEPGKKINERSPLEPKWDYPKSKVKTERLILEKQGHIPAVILRIAGVYDDMCHSIPLAHQIQRIYEKQLTSKLFPGDISHGQAFIHLEDLIDAILRIIERRHELLSELTLLLGEPDTLSCEELQKAFGWLIHNEEWKTKVIPKALAKTGAWLQDQIPFDEPFIKPWMIDLADDHFELDITKARKLLNWEPKHSLRGTLPKMIKALKSDPRKFYKENNLGELPSHVEKGDEKNVTREDGTSTSIRRRYGLHLPDASGSEAG